jgi:RHS repeat-associated protein
VYKNITEFDIFGNGSQNTLGNGLTENTAYSNKSGQMLLKTIAKNNSNIMNIDYSAYDGFGNLRAVDITTGNIGNQHSFSETYDYDALHRLESNAVNGITTINYSYDAVGNLLSKSDYATQYDYENGATGGPNAVKRIHRSGSWKTFAYDARGNMAQGDGLTSASYNAMDKPTQIVKDGKTLNFTYGPQHMRFKQVNGSVTTFYSDKLYEEEVTGTKTTWRAYIDDIAVISQTTNEGATIRYTHRDRLGSARVFTDHNGQVEAERNYDPFGKPRLASGGLKSFGASKLGDLADAKTNRGFTDHEHLDSVELIHMNGRVYDYSLGRFMSVDPVIQSPTNSQSINPYSYIMNNPLSGTDPTGYTSCDADDPENCQEVAEELGKDEKADITQRQSVAGSRIKRNVKVGTMTGNGNGTVNVQIGNMSATADIGAPASNNKGANSTNQNDDAQKSLIVGITGGGGHKSGAGPDLLNLAEQYKDDDGVDVQTFEWDDSKAARKAIINFRKDNPEGRVVLMGYSLGGRAAVNIANNLGKKDISIDSLVTFDAYSFVGSSHKLRYNSVKQALNFYQQNPTDRSWGISPAGASNPYPGSVINSKHINVINHNYTGDSRGINHINIIDYAIRDYGGQINDHIK